MTSAVDPSISVDSQANKSYTALALIASGVFVCLVVLVFTADAADQKIVEWINYYSGRSALADALVYDVYTYGSFNTVLFLTLIWWCWFQFDDETRRSRVLIGTCAGLGASFISRILQYMLPTHARPFYQPTFHVMPLMKDVPLNTWASFPSDHSTLLSTWVTTLLIVKPRLWILAVPCLVINEMARIYVGAHYPFDVLAGAALGIAIGCFVQHPRIVSLARPIVSYAQSAPEMFYPAAFFISYQLATVFFEVRSVVSIVAILRRLRH